MRRHPLVLLVVLLVGCGTDGHGPDPGTAGRTAGAAVVTDSPWNSATLYFLLTDRFQNGDTTNDYALGRARDGAPLRSFLGGDLAGVRQRLDAGYFDSLGVDVLWMTPVLEQIRGSVDEGTGKSYGFHGYWTRDWTRVDPAFGTEGELRSLVAAAHARGIRVIMDAVINHTGPVTPQDPQWPDDWVRTTPRCAYQDYASTVDCTLVANLPDVRTDSDEPVALPTWLLDKWAGEGRLEEETADLDAWFERTGHPRAPRFYIIKWLTDWVREVGFDGYRVDTAKHFEESVSTELRAEADAAFADWKAAHPDEVLDDRPFYMLGEVYNYTPAGGRYFDFGDEVVDYFDHGYDALINFGFKSDARESIEELFSSYADALNGDLRGVSVVNYVSSHDDAGPYDPQRRDPKGAGTKLLLAPGAAQIYYGDEVARPLQIARAEGDANLRSPMDWSVVAAQASDDESVLEHWRKLGRFRRAHPSIGAGEHRRIQADPYVFARTEPDGADRVVVAMDQPAGEKTVPVGGVFEEGAVLVDAYSGVETTVDGDQVTLETPFATVLLAPRD